MTMDYGVEGSFRFSAFVDGLECLSGTMKAKWGIVDGN